MTQTYLFCSVELDSVNKYFIIIVNKIILNFRNDSSKCFITEIWQSCTCK